MRVDAALVRVKFSDLCPGCQGDLERQVTTGDPHDGISFSYCQKCGAEWRQVELRGRLLLNRRLS